MSIQPDAPSMFRVPERSRPPLPGLRRRLRLPIAAVLVVGFGTLMLVAVASVLFIGLGSAGRNTFSLLQDKADLALDNVQVRLGHQLDPVRDQADFLAGRILAGAFDTDDPKALTDALPMALAATTQVTGNGYIPTVDMTARWSGRIEGRPRSRSGQLGHPTTGRQTGAG